MVTKWLFIEGTTNEDNGDLSEGFRMLFEQKLKGKMPKIKMGDGKGSTIDKFQYAVFKKNEAGKRFLLVDLDGNKKEADLKENELDKSNCFYMVQEMESWLQLRRLKSWKRGRFRWQQQMRQFRLGWWWRSSWL